MYTPTQLEIIRIFGKKELTFGCKVLFGEKIITVGSCDDEFYSSKTPDKILGHEPHLEDVFRVAEERGFTFDLINFGTKQPRLTSLMPSNENFNIPYNPTLPLLSQPEETLTQLISLL